ncbi:hypothetical protein SLA2020_401000 [Shorea laevis]
MQDWRQKASSFDHDDFSNCFMLNILDGKASCYLCIQKIDKKSFNFNRCPEQYPKISYGELSQATNEFSSSNLIGEGSFGSVYKGILSRDGMLVAVKVLNLKSRGAIKSFMAECETLRNI